MAEEKNKIEARLVGMMTEATDLRHGEGGDPGGRIGLPPVGAAVPDLIDSLRRVRARLDRVEEIQAQATRIHYLFVRQLEALRFEKDIAYGEAFTENSVTRSQEYKTRDEKNSEAFLKSIENQRAVRAAEKNLSFANEAVEIIKRAYWGLNALREDHLAVLRSLQFESHLER